MNRRTIVILLIILCLITALTGCTNTDYDVESPIPAPPPEIVETHVPENQDTDEIEVVTDPTETETEESLGDDTGLADDSFLEVTFLDVGQADAIVINCDGEYLFIDGGNRGDSDYIYSWMDKHNVNDIKAVIVTHAHEDHCGGVPAIFEHSAVGTIYSPVSSYDSKTFKNVVNKAAEQGLELLKPKMGDSIEIGSAELEFIGPNKDYDDANNTSIVTRLEYGDISFMFTGDMEELAEKDVLETGYFVESTVLKVGHHGSDTSTCYQWLNAVDPQYSVISVGTDNKYGHPCESTLSKLNDDDCEIYRTDYNGEITFTCTDGSSFLISCEK